MIPSRLNVRTCAALVCAFALLLQLPSGLFHLLFGKWIYARDILLNLGILLGVLCDTKTFKRLFCTWLGAFFFGLVILVTFLVCIRGEFTLAFTLAKWVSIWIASCYSGYVLWNVFGTKGVTIWLLAFLCYGLIDATVGSIELKNQTYFLAIDKNDATAFGQQLGMSQKLENQIRVRGLQRDVFSFANLMATSAIVSAVLAVNARRETMRVLPSIACCAGFLVLQVLSGGRSAFIGILGSLAIGIVAYLGGGKKLWFSRIVIALLIVGIGFVTYKGIGNFVTSTVNMLGMDAYFLNVDSSFDRNDNWANLLKLILSSDSSMLIGVPASNDGAVPVAIADNWLLWIMYHGGLVLLSLLVAMCCITIPKVVFAPTWGPGTLVLLGFLLAEGLARESFFFPSAIILFLVYGAARAEFASVSCRPLTRRTLLSKNTV